MAFSLSSSGISAMFSSMNGRYDAASSMSSLLGQRAQLQNGSYGRLMKAYVKKVGNGNALKAYQKNGSTVTDSAGLEKPHRKSGSTVKDSAGLEKSHKKGGSTVKDSASLEKSHKTDSTATKAAKYAKLHSSWLDNQLKSYNSAAKPVTAADNSVAINTAV